jgi:putative DNA primase/helicase
LTPESNTPRGATPAEWWAFTGELGFGAHVLPCVPAAPDVRVAKGSALEGKVGKIPSAFNQFGEAHGIVSWQKRPILPAEVALWRKDPRLNLCLRTGKISGVGAIDVDIHSEDAFEVKDALYTFWIENGLGDMPLRERANSSKFLVPFRMAEGGRKRIIETKHGRIECLLDGQQFVAAGSHSSGARYQWSPDLPSELPTLTLQQFEALWQTLTQNFASETSSTSTTATPSVSTKSPPPTTNSATQSSSLSVMDEPTWQEIRSALRFMLDKAEDNETWSEIGYALLSLKQFPSGATGRDVFLDFSRKAKGYTEGAPEKWWNDHKDQPTRTDYRHVFTIARARGWGKSSDPAVFTSVPASVPEAAVAPANTEPEKRIIRVISSALPTNIQELNEIMREELYTQGPQHLVRLGRENLKDSIRRSTDQINMLRVSPGWARVRLTELATFMIPRGEGYSRVSAPAELVSTWMDQTDWPHLRPLDAIARAPFVRDDGSICDTPGYDDRSRALYIPSREYPAISESPTERDARAALDGVRKVFDQFPWDTPAAESAFLAHVLSEAARLAIDRCPMFWYTAPSAGTGKSMLSEMPSIIVHGTEPALRPWVQDGDELRKTLFASLLAGDRSIAFDNVPTGHKARAPELCAFLTSAIWKDRKLGVSETYAVPNRVVVSASGNNVTPVSDLARRCLVVRLDANTEKLKERRFTIPNLREHVMTNRAQLLVYALTIIKAYAVAGTRVESTPMPSFERWSRTVREPLLWLGHPDPCETQSETDDETGSLGHTFALLVSHFGDREFTAQEIANLAGGVADSNGELSALLLQGGCSEPSSQLKVGYWLRGERGRVSDGRKLVSVKRDRTGMMKWKLVRIGDELA